jgi:hypothetical protein
MPSMQVSGSLFASKMNTFAMLSAGIVKRDIRPIWAKRITSEDSVKVDKLQKELKTQQAKHLEYDITLSKLHLAYEMSKNELTKKDMEIRSLKAMLTK